MRQLNVVGQNVTANTQIKSRPYVPSLQRTAGQPPPIAANGGLSYMSFDQDGDGGTAAALDGALAQIAEGEGQRVTEMITNAPPGASIKTKWGGGVPEIRRVHGLYSSEQRHQGAVRRPSAANAVYGL